jgi:hypothetical protein
MVKARPEAALVLHATAKAHPVALVLRAMVKARHEATLVLRAMATAHPVALGLRGMVKVRPVMATDPVEKGIDHGLPETAKALHVTAIVRGRLGKGTAHPETDLRVMATGLEVKATDHGLRETENDRRVTAIVRGRPVKGTAHEGTGLHAKGTGPGGKATGLVHPEKETAHQETDLRVKVTVPVMASVKNAPSGLNALRGLNRRFPRNKQFLAAT